jgi:prepilin-type N-terminal cleavage/methylation domain-containing protein
MQVYKNFKQKRSRGFTLVELLIVIAILGVLAGVVLVAINPLEQIARAQDAGRESAIGQLGRATTNYQTSQQLQDYTNLNTAATATPPTWQTTLQNANEIKQVVSVNAAASNCTTAGTVNGGQSGVCFATSGSNANAMIWTVLTSKSEWTRAGCSGTQIVITAWDSTQGKAGVGCVATATSVPAAGITLK